MEKEVYDAWLFSVDAVDEEKKGTMKVCFEIEMPIADLEFVRDNIGNKEVQIIIREN